MMPAQLDLGVVNVGVQGTGQPLTLRNDGLTPVALTRLILSDSSSFMVQRGDCANGVVPAGGVCVANVAFTPASVGIVTGSLRLDGSGPEVGLRGEGAQPPPPPVNPPQKGNTPLGANTPLPPASRPTAPPSIPPKPANTPPNVPPAPVKTPPVIAAHFTQHPFQTQATVDASIRLPVVLKNNGETTIAIVSFRFEGGHAGDFTLTQETCELGVPQEQCDVNISFTPHEPGAHSITLVAEADGAVLDRTELIGTAIDRPRPRAQVSPASLQFAKRGEQKYAIVQNTGQVPLQFGRVAIDNAKDF